MRVVRDNVVQQQHSHKRLLVVATSLVPYRMESFFFGLSYFGKAVLFAFVEQVCLGCSKVDNLWTPIPIVPQLNTFTTILGVSDTLVAANNTPALVTAVVAFITNMYNFFRIHKRIAHTAKSVTCVEGKGQRKQVRKKERRRLGDDKLHPFSHHSHFSHRRPIATPGCFRHITRSG